MISMRVGHALIYGPPLVIIGHLPLCLFNFIISRLRVTMLLLISSLIQMYETDLQMCIPEIYNVFKLLVVRGVPANIIRLL